MLNDSSSARTLVNTRRSGRPREMIAPGPDRATLRAILEAAIRVPDHGKLAPWRFVVVGEDQRDRLAALFANAYRAEKPDAGRLEIEAMDALARMAPALVVVLSAPDAQSHIPRFEQELSAGAVCMNLLLAVHAHGFVGGWITGWPAYSDDVRDAFGTPDMRIAGFFYIGTPGKPLEERPRPEPDTVIHDWA